MYVLRFVPPRAHPSPGHAIVRPNRDKAECKATKAAVVVLLLASVALMMVVTIGGWSKLQGLKPVNFAWCIAYLLIAVYVARWSRGMLPIAGALATLLLIVALIAVTGIAGTSWFDRDAPAFAAPRTIFGGKGLSPDTLGVVTLIIAPLQLLLVAAATRGLSQGWNVEVEVPEQ
ncbi:MAG: hypothetical protein ABSG43_14665 [Solirubrobacteraceae bacterium]|jgi:hypothetical protein